MAYELAKQDTSDQIVIMLEETQNRGLRVRAIDVHVSAMKVRFSANRANSVEDVFQNDAAQLVRSICDAAPHTKQIVNVPDFCLRIRGLTIDGYTVLVETTQAGVRQIEVRLNRAIGNALALFKISPSADAGLSLFKSRIVSGPSHQIDSDRLFDEMLSHLYLPLVNLNAYLRQVLDGQINGRGESFSSSVVQLKTKAEVLQFAFDRLISEMMLDKFTDPVAPPPPAAIAQPA